MTPYADAKAAAPADAFACAFGLGFAATAPAGSMDELARSIIPPVRERNDGVEVSFALEADEAVRLYAEAEARRRPTLGFAVERTDAAVVLTVTERPGS